MYQSKVYRNLHIDNLTIVNVYDKTVIPKDQLKQLKQVLKQQEVKKERFIQHESLERK